MCYPMVDEYLHGALLDPPLLPWCCVSPLVAWLHSPRLLHDDVQHRAEIWGTTPNNSWPPNAGALMQQHVLSVDFVI